MSSNSARWYKGLLPLLVKDKHGSEKIFLLYFISMPESEPTISELFFLTTVSTCFSGTLLIKLLFERDVACWLEVEDINSLRVLELPPTWLAAVEFPRAQHDEVFYVLFTSTTIDRERGEKTHSVFFTVCGHGKESDSRIYGSEAESVWLVTTRLDSLKKRKEK